MAKFDTRMPWSLLRCASFMCAAGSGSPPNHPSPSVLQGASRTPWSCRSRRHALRPGKSRFPASFAEVGAAMPARSLFSGGEGRAMVVGRKARLQGRRSGKEVGLKQSPQHRTEPCRCCAPPARDKTNGFIVFLPSLLL